MTTHHEYGTSAVRGSLEKLAAEAKQGSADLQQMVKAALDGLAALQEVDASESAAANVRVAASAFWQPFRTACASEQPAKVRQVALDSIQKLIVYRHLDASAAGTSVERTTPRSTAGELARSFRAMETQYAPLLENPDAPEKPADSRALADDVVETICLACAAPAGSAGNVATGPPTMASTPEDQVQLQVLKCLLTAVTSENMPVHGLALLQALQTCFYIYLHTSNAVNQATARASLTQMVNDCFAHLERGAAQLEAATPSAPAPELLAERVAQGRVDVRVVFEFLCNQCLYSDGGGGDGASGAASEFDAVAAASSAHIDHALTAASSRARSLALELVLSVLTNAGPTVRFDERFSERARALLPFVIARNAITTTPLLFELAVAIFVLTVQHYRAVLKSEIEALLSTLFLHMLETPSAPATVKVILLHGFLKLASRPHILADLYLNYDCDLTMASVFERLVATVSKLAQARRRYDAHGASGGAVSALLGFGSSAREQHEALVRQQRALKHDSLRLLVEMAQSLVLWSRPLAPDMPLVDVLPVSARGWSSDDGLDGDDEHVVSREETLGARQPGDGFAGETGADGGVEGVDEVASSNKHGATASHQRTRRIRADTLRSAPLSNVSSGASSPASVVAGLAPGASEDAVVPIVVSNRNPLNSVLLKREGSDAGFSRHGSGRLAGASADAAGNETAGDGSDAGSALTSTPSQLTVEELANRKQLYRQLLKLFRSKPEKAVKLLISHQFIVATANPSKAHKESTEVPPGTPEADETPELTSTAPKQTQQDPLVWAVAHFFHKTPGLDRRALGEFLGSGDAFAVQVMFAYVDEISFEGLEFVAALRMFLQLFRLPGEAQKIDRIMEKFADRFCECNPALFAKADTAYTLAFSTIMLNTDQHSSHVKNKMTKADFLKNNRGINDNGDLPDAFLGAVFDDIAGREIAMDGGALTAGSGASSTFLTAAGYPSAAGAVSASVASADAYRAEMTHMQKRSQHYLLTRGAERAAQMAPYVAARSPELVKSMFVVLAWPLMAALAVVFEEPDADEPAGGIPVGSDTVGSVSGGLDGTGATRRRSGAVAAVTGGSLVGGATHVEYCLQAFASAVRLACLFGMETERDAFVTSLCKLSGLVATASAAHGSDERWLAGLKLRLRHVKAVKTLIALANALGDRPQTAWNPILKVFSLLDRLNSAGTFGINAPAVPNGISTGGPPGGGPAAVGPAAAAGPAAASSSASLPVGGPVGAAEAASQDATSGAGMPNGDVPIPPAKSEEAPEPKQPTADAGEPAEAPAGPQDPADAAKPAQVTITEEEQCRAELQSQAVAVAIDRVYASTVNFSGPAIVYFFRAMCLVSGEEIGLDASALSSSMSGPVSPLGQSHIHHMLSGSSSELEIPRPRMYLLQKMVEIAYYNMNRIRFEWGHIWKILQPYFNCMGCHPHLEVSTYAVDSLRQLSMKFLERDELAHFHTQSELLRSFEWIVRTTDSLAIRELVLQSVLQMVYARSRNLKSGWKSIFAVLAKVATAGAPGTAEAHAQLLLAKRSFGIVELVHRDYFSTVIQAGAFVDFVNCLAEFALSELGKDDETVMKCFMVLKHCAELLTREHGVGSNPPSAAPSAPGSPTSAARALSSDMLALPASPAVQTALAGPGSQFVTEDAFFLKWFPIFSAFSRVIVESRSSLVRATAIDTLFDILRVAGRLFRPRYWRTIFRSVIFPIFEDLLEDGSLSGSGQSSARSAARAASDVAIWIHGIRLLVDVYSEFVDVLGDFSELGAILLALLRRRDDKLATTGQQCLVHFLRSNWIKFGTLKCWEPVTALVERAFEATTPLELFAGSAASDAGSLRSTPAAPSPPVEDDLDSVPPTSIPASPERDDGGEAGEKPLPPPPQGAQQPDTPRRGGALRNMDFAQVVLKCAIHLELVQSVRDLVMTSVVRSDAYLASATQDGSPADAWEEFAGRTLQLASAGAGIPASPASTAVSPTSPRHAPQRQKSLVPVTGIPTERRVRRSTLPALMYMDPAFLHRWMLCVYRSFAFAHEFNSNYDLRYAIWKAGLTKQMPNLIKQETIAFSTFVRFLFAVYSVYGDEGYIDGAGLVCRREADASPAAGALVSIADRIVDETTGVLRKFAGYLSDQTKFQRDIALWSPVVITVYVELLRLDHCWQPLAADTPPAALSTPSSASDPGARFVGLRREIITYFQFGIQLMIVERLEVRNILQEFMERVADTFLRIPASPGAVPSPRSPLDSASPLWSSSGDAVYDWVDPSGRAFRDHVVQVPWDDPVALSVTLSS